MANTKHEDAILKMGFDYFRDTILKFLGIDYDFVEAGITELVYCIIDISLNNLPVFPSNCVDFAQRCHRIASFSRLVDEKTFCVV